MERAYLVRYGLMGDIDRFAAEPAAAFERGQTVVVRSHRGTELGEVLVPAPARSLPATSMSESARVLRLAAEEDIERAHLARQQRADRFAACQRIFGDGLWPLDLVDVEPLLDGDRTVLYYLGPHGFDVAGLRSSLHANLGFHAIFQPAGVDLPESRPADPGHACGSCGSGGACGSSGGCGSAGHACSGCAVKELMTRNVG